MVTGRRRRSSRLVQAIVIVAVLLVIPAAVEYLRQAGLRNQWLQAERDLQKQLAISQEERQALEARKAYVQSDAYVEEAARSRLQMTRPGEVLVILVGTPPLELSAAPPPRERATSGGPSAALPR